MSALALNGGEAELARWGGLPHWPRVREGDEEALLGVLRSGNWGSTAGDQVARFQQEFAAYQGADEGIALVNGTLAIVAALRACRVGLGDEVIVPPYTFIATAAAPLLVGAVPVFADVDPDSHLMDPEAVRSVITPRTRAIIPVHLGGRAADMDTFRQIAAEHDLRVIEDCAQAVGARYKGAGVGTLGDVGTFSFQSSKNMSAGEGGAVVANSSSMGERLYSLINVGRVRGGGWYEHRNLGYNLRMTEFQGALLRRQLHHHPGDQEVRERNALILDEELRGVDGLYLSAPDPNLTSHGRHLYLMRVPELGRKGLRDTAVDALKAEGVEASTGYVPLHRNRAILDGTRALAKSLGQELPASHCPMAELVSRDTMWLPQQALLGDDELTHAIARAVRKVVGAAAELDAIAK